MLNTAGFRVIHTVGATHEIRLSVSQIAALDKAEFLILF